MDEKVMDRDTMRKEKQKIYTDDKRSAMKKVIRKVGGDTTVRSCDSGKEYGRNVTHFRKIGTAAASDEKNEKQSLCKRRIVEMKRV